MSSEETTGQIEIVEQPAKPKQIIKISFKKLYKNELTRRKNYDRTLVGNSIGIPYDFSGGTYK